MIFKKDGTVYQLRGPNPVMREQTVWNEQEKLVLHNCKWNPTLEQQKEPQVKPVQTKKKEATPVVTPVESEPVAEPEPQITPAETVVQTVEEVNPEPQIEEKPAMVVPEGKKIVLHCLKAQEYEVVDEFYGDVKKRFKYEGGQFTAEAILVSATDLVLVFWTTVNLGKYSIVFPSNFEKRWWQVSEVEEHDGFYHTAVPTNLNPSFD